MIHDEPDVPHLVFSSRAGDHLFVASHSRLFDLPKGAFDAESPAGRELLTTLAALGIGEEDLADVPDVEPQSISLNVSASCNLACGYCYAGQGEFGGRQTGGLEWRTAREAIDALFHRARRDRPVTIGFLGGEPFLGRPIIHQAVAYASEVGTQEGLDVRFSVTTNGTLLRDEDHRLLRAHSFAVTVSLDGDAVSHDRHRRNHGGRGTWARALRGVKPLLINPGRAQVAARATVSRDDMDLARQFDGLVGAGFNEIGFSPLRTGPEALGGGDWSTYLGAIRAVATDELQRARRGATLRLTNLAVALKQIHRGAASPYPCGAGGGYFSVGADGRWYACHRAVGETEFDLGSSEALDDAARRHFLVSRHVDREVDCQSCWARYLCSGGCHHERAARSAASCDFVRGWLEFCLIAYCESGTPSPKFDGSTDA